MTCSHRETKVRQPFNTFENNTFENPPTTTRMIRGVMRHKHGRPKKYQNREQVTLYFSEHEVEQLRALAAQRGLHLSEMGRAAVLLMISTALGEAA
jgi:hypothetical protein